MALPIEKPGKDSNFSASQIGQGGVGKYGQTTRTNSLDIERENLFKGNSNTSRPKGASQDAISRMADRAKEPVSFVKMPSREEQIGTSVTGSGPYRVNKYEVPKRNSVFQSGYARIRDVMKKITGNAEINREERNFMNIKNLRAKARMNKEYKDFLERNKGKAFIREKDIQKEIREMNRREVYESGTKRVIDEAFEDKLKDL